MTHRCLRATHALAAFALLLGVCSPVFAGQDDAPPEHPVIKPMTGATPLPASLVQDFGRLVVNYRDASGIAQPVAEGRYWHLFYQLDNRETSRDEILSNYETEARRIGGEILNRRSTRLVFRITRPGGGVVWCRLDVGSAGSFELEIVDEAGLDLSVEFDAAALLTALNRDGRVAIYGIQFDVDLATLRPGSGEVLDTIASILIAETGMRLEVQGHTDATGAAERNQILSLERAGAVVSALRLYGVDAGRLEARGFGPDQPIGDNDTEKGRQQNRRVELVRLP
jgi:outer membrane protein OmpA-like peptidoglycan-associated protein